MTLCIAAQCTDNQEVKVVFAADFAVESDIATAEVENKILHCSSRAYPVLIAGSGSRARELCTYISERWDEADEEIFLEICRKAVRNHKHVLADEYISSALGISYDELLTTFHQNLPVERYNSLISDVVEIRLGCDIIVCQLQDEEDALLVRINGNGDTEVCNNFAAIGSGMYIAESSLFHRQHAKEESLANTIYHVYEAMRLGSHAPGVGERFIMNIASYGNKQTRWSRISEEYLAKLEVEYKKFGPQEVKNQKLERKLIRKLL